MRGGGMRLAEKPKQFGLSLKKLFKALKYYRLGICVTVILAILSTMLIIAGPRIMGNMINEVAEDFMLGQVYDGVKNLLPEDLELPSGTTLETLPDVIQTLVEDGRLDSSVLSELQDLQSTTSPDSELMERLTEKQITKINNLDLNIRPNLRFDSIARTALLLLAFYISAAIMSYISGWVITNITMKVVRRFRRDISRKINRLPISYFDNHQFGDTLSRVTNDIDTIAQSLSQSITQLISAATMLIGILVMMLTISWQMTLIALATLPISLVFIRFVTARSQRLFRAQQDDLGNLNGHIEETYSGQTIIKAFSGEEKAKRRFREVNDRLYRNGWRAQFLSGLMMPITHFISNLGYVATAITGGYLAVNRVIGIGDIAAFIQYVSQFNQPITQFAQITNTLQSAVAASERVFEFLEEPEQSSDPEDAISLESVRGEIEFKNVKFSYDGENKVIKGFSAKIKPGMKVAIVGPTGAGKTTLVNLLMRFYDPTSGHIFIDGVDTIKMKRSEVRRLFGMVLQDTWLTSGSVEENIKYSKPNAMREEIRDVARATHINHMIEALPKGYRTPINGDTETISVGEKQLLTIARAILANPPMTILDEATSNVDTRTEILIQSAMEKLTEGRTSFVIAHRLSTIRDADLILAIREGNIVEHGTHTTLMKQQGFYAELYNSQFSVDT
jgi:ATP-binding cassette subfamily B protein